MIGILISVDQELETIPKIEFKFKGTEGGPSGGFMMSLAIYDTLTGSKLSQNRKIIGTGSIDQYGNVGEIGGVKYKIKGAVKADADIFFVPAGQNYEDVMEVKLEKKYDITVVPVNTLDDAIEYLQNN
jgi:PDZ domain-containing protein